jgi:hypothetical protein
VLSKSSTTANLLAIGLLSVGSAFGLPLFGEPADLTGSRSEPASIVTGGNYASDEENLTISWTIASNAGNPALWDYSYTLSNFANPGVSHFIISLSPGCSTDPGCITGADNFEYGDYSGANPSNPGMPATISGVKFDFGSEDPSSYAFTSNRAPVWGDFYFKGGSDSYAYNTGLTNHNSVNILDFIARPDTSGGAPPAEIPEPGTWALLASGVVFIAVGRKKLFSN